MLRPRRLPGGDQHHRAGCRRHLAAGPALPRELEVLAALARSRSNRQIARALQISEETVKAHVSSILAKL
jgi:DNA-binding NarL/FixJ family response regulator